MRVSETYRPPKGPKRPGTLAGGVAVERRRWTWGRTIAHQRRRATAARSDDQHIIATLAAATVPAYRLTAMRGDVLRPTPGKRRRSLPRQLSISRLPSSNAIASLPPSQRDETIDLLQDRSSRVSRAKAATTAKRLFEVVPERTRSRRETRYTANASADRESPKGRDLHWLSSWLKAPCRRGVVSKARSQQGDRLGRLTSVQISREPVASERIERRRTSHTAGPKMKRDRRHERESQSPERPMRINITFCLTRLPVRSLRHQRRAVIAAHRPQPRRQLREPRPPALAGKQRYRRGESPPCSECTRGGRNYRADSSSRHPCNTARGGDERSDLGRILQPRRALDAAGDVDAVRPRGRDRRAPTFSGVRPPASRNGRRARAAISGQGAGTPPPPKPSTKASYSQSAGDQPASRGERRLVAHAHDADRARRVQRREVGGPPRRREAARDPAPARRCGAPTSSAGALTNTPTLSTPAGTAASTSRAALGLDVALRARPEVDADRVRARPPRPAPRPRASSRRRS